MFGTSMIDYKIYKKFTWLIYAILIIMLFAVGFIGMEEGGAKRWIKIAGINFQPSEVAKIGFIIFFASI